MSILATERATYEDVWSSVDGYAEHAPGEHWLPVFLDMVGKPKHGTTALDAGTGSGKGALALKAAGFDVTLCDVTDAGLVEDAKALPFVEACLWREIPKALPMRYAYDYVYCTDVLEHIPPEFTMLVIDQLLQVAKRGVFLSISLVPDQFGVWVGKSLHQTVRPFVWWRDHLAELGEVIEARDCAMTGVYLVRPR